MTTLYNNTSDEEDTSAEEEVTPERVILKMEHLMVTLATGLQEGRLPVLELHHVDDSTQTKHFNLQQCRGITSILQIVAYSHALLTACRTTTTREVYYHYVTYFRHQQECEDAILDTCRLLRVPRHCLGLKASPKGWFAGDLQIVQAHGVLDARLSTQGAPITSEWLIPAQKRGFVIQTERAIGILVIEKEGIYNRLAEDRFWKDFPCILVTGKGFPDLATRAMVHALHTELNLPVWGLCDHNPFGVLVLQTYNYGSERRGVDGGDRFSVPVQWIGLRPSHVQQILPQLPDEVFQQMTDRDLKRLDDTLLCDTSRWCAHKPARVQELQAMRAHSFKLELEALHWISMDYLADWLGQVLNYQQQRDALHPEQRVQWLEMI